MATSAEYLASVLERLSDLNEITHRRMMGEYMLYYRGRLFGYLCDDRFLVKPVPSARRMMPDAVYEPPYDGAKPMLVIEDAADKAFLKELVEAMYEELPVPKPKKKKEG